MGDTARLPLIDECEYYTTTNDAGHFIGRVKQFPDLKTKACRSRIDATDEIVTRTAAHLRRLHGALPVEEATH